MSRYKCLCGLNNNVIKKFLKLPSEIYVPNKLPQDYKTEKSILQGKHPLSNNFTVYPYVMIDELGATICRCLLTYYSNDPIAYVGFFEAKPNKLAVREMFMHVEQKVREDGKTKMLGPVDASIYIRYRLKTNLFGKTYTGEPYNMSYYKQYWTQAGFGVEAKYVSNQLRKVHKKDLDPKLERIYQRYVERGYEFISPTNETFNKCLRDVYGVMMESYSDFVGFKKITEQQFMDLFGDLKKIANYNMMKLAYKDGKLHAFAIALPNYGELTRGKLTLFKWIKLKQVQKNPKEYVILYVGADKTAGLGSAIMHHIRDILYKNQCTSITALIKEGNLTGKVYTDLYTDTFEYELFSKNL